MIWEFEEAKAKAFVHEAVGKIEELKDWGIEGFEEAEDTKEGPRGAELARPGRRA